MSELVLYGSRLKTGFVAIGCTLIALHYWNAMDWDAENGRLPLLGVVSFGVLALLAAVGALLRLPRIVLTPDGFTMRTGLATRHHSWNDIDHFRVVSRLTIEYWYSDAFLASEPKAPMINVFELSSVELAAVLSDWHAKHHTKAANHPLERDALPRAPQRER